MGTWKVLFSLDFGNQASDDIVVFVRFLLGEVISIVMMVLLEHNNKSTFTSRFAYQYHMVGSQAKTTRSGGLES